MSTTYISMTFSISADSTTLVLPMTNFSGIIDWGDGNTQVYSSYTLNPSNTYINSGTYNVNVNNVTNLNIFGSSASSFSIYRNSLTNFSYLNNISTLTNLSSLFFECNKNFTINFASNVTSNVTNMALMFRNASLFNQPITLNCSSCTTLEQFLLFATNFNSSVNLSNTSKVQNMSLMFRDASSFNQQITLDCSSCTTLEQFLLGATNFNNSLNLTPIPNLLNATNMIVSTSLSTTNYSNLLTLWGSQSVLKPNVTLTATGVTYNPSAQSSRTTLISSPNNWNITDGGIFTSYISMTFSISAANTTLVLPMTNFVGTIDWGDGNTQVYSSSTLNPSKNYVNSGTYNVNIGNVTNLTIFGSSSSFPIYSSSLTNFSYLINISTLTNLNFLFNNCSKNFTINFASNVTSNVTDMSFMFNNATLFNQPITLNCSSCTTLQQFLSFTTNFNSSVSLTNTSKVTSMRSMFYSASSFNQPIELDCSSCTTLQTLLTFATNFNSPIKLSNTSKVTSMRNMFYSASSFNQEIDLDCSSCNTLYGFLYNTTNFNSPLKLRNTSKVTDMSFMVEQASSFNQPIDLECSSCTTLESFLQGATNFDSSLNLTPIPNLLNASNMIVNTSLSTTNYSNLLILWGSQPVLKPNVSLTATGVKYNSSAQSYRTTLVSSPNNWNIIDGGIIQTTVIDVSSNITTTYGDVPFIYNYSSNNPSTPTYSSSNTSVATINSSGLVTSLSVGTTTLIINQPATSNYTDGSANSILTVQPATTVIDVSSNITTAYGNVPFIYNYRSNNPSTPTYSSSNTSVATINSSGLVTILSPGTTMLTINQSSTANYTDGSANSILTVQPATTVIDVSSNITITYGNVPFFTYNYSSNNPSTPTYSSSNTSVATINSSGLVTILSEGTTTLIINQPATSNYTHGSSNSILTVKYVTTIDVSSNITTTYGNVPFIYNYSSNNPSTPTYSSSNTSVAIINSSGLVRILSGGTTTLIINQSATSEYTDGSANSILTAVANSNPVIITNGNGLENFLTTNETNAILIENMYINENLVNQGNVIKMISSDLFNEIYLVTPQ